VNFTGTVDSVGEHLGINVGNVNLGANPIELKSLSLGGALISTADLTITEQFNWNFGVLSGAGPINVSSAATMTISGGCLDGRTFNNAGTAVLMNGLCLNRGAVFNNLPGGTFEIRNDVGIGYGNQGAFGSFNNAGIFSKTVGTGQSSIFQVNFTNSGTIDALTGHWTSTPVMSRRLARPAYVEATLPVWAR
jgi:hypothetical protein